MLPSVTKWQEANFLIGKRSKNSKLDSHTRPMQSDFGCSRQQRWLDSICTKCWHYWEGNCSKQTPQLHPATEFMHLQIKLFSTDAPKQMLLFKGHLSQHTYDFSAAFYDEKLASATAITVVFFLWQALINSKLNNHTRPMQSNFGCSRQQC